MTAGPYRPEHFVSIHELTDTLKEKEFDILILDRMIEKADSITWIKTFKGLASNMKIMILGSLSGVVNQKRRFDVGADDYFEKPFQYSELSLRVNKLVKRDMGQLSKE